jgi:hypothetical protein
VHDDLPREEEAPMRRLKAIVGQTSNHCRGILTGMGLLEGDGDAAPVGESARVARAISRGSIWSCDALGMERV